MLQVVYLIFFILGIVLPFSQFIPFLLDRGLDLNLFFEQLFTNRISSFFGMDVIVSILVLLTFVIWEGSRLKMKYLWGHILASLLGVSCGLPLFLLMRQRQLEEVAKKEPFLT